MALLIDAVHSCELAYYCLAQTRGVHRLLIFRISAVPRIWMEWFPTCVGIIVPQDSARHARHASKHASRAILNIIVPTRVISVPDLPRLPRPPIRISTRACACTHLYQVQKNYYYYYYNANNNIDTRRRKVSVIITMTATYLIIGSTLMLHTHQEINYTRGNITSI